MVLRRRSLWLVGGALLLVVLTAFALLVWPFGEDDGDGGDLSIGIDEPIDPEVPTTPGEPGIGDPYFPLAGNGGYDVAEYDLDLSYEPGTALLTGTATITLRATRPLSAFNLDLRLPASAVTVDGTPAGFTQTDRELTVTPARALRATHRVVVDYVGRPATIPYPEGERPWRLTSDGAVVVGQPDVASWWFPANDHPLDKSTIAVSMSVPAGVEVISNGALVGGPEPAGAGRDRWRWSGGGEMAPYLAFLAIGQFDLVRRPTANGPYLAAYAESLDPDTAAAARESVEQTPEIVAWLSSVFGPYPWAQLGGVVADDDDTGFALENQTRPVYAQEFFAGGPDTAVVVHELAHQWFGDSVAVHHWRDIWLNEGFATYAEWLYEESQGGDSAAESARFFYRVLAGEPDFWAVRLDDPGPADIFDGAVYYRGAMAVQAFRVAMGDPAFFTLLREWPTRRRGGHGEVTDFVALAQELSGKDLTPVVTTWLQSPVQPPAPPG